MSFYINCHVIPYSKKQSFIKIKPSYYKAKLTSPPEKGKANRELIALLSAHFKLEFHCFTITAGATSPIKLIKVENANHPR